MSIQIDSVVFFLYYAVIKSDKLCFRYPFHRFDYYDFNVNVDEIKMYL